VDGSYVGEHIDYCGFSVLPAAVDKDVLVAFSTAPASPSADTKLPSPSAPNKTVFILRNLESKYSATDFEVDLNGDGSDLEINQDHHWSNYFIAGTKGILSHLAKNKAKWESGTPDRVLVMVHGTVPEGSGLSSSSAMTTASAMAVLEVVGRRDGMEFICRRDVTNVAIEGGESPSVLFRIRKSSPFSLPWCRTTRRCQLWRNGSICQCLQSVAASPSHVSLAPFHAFLERNLMTPFLTRSEFMPQLEARAIPLPKTDPAFSFVVANTLVKSNKKLTAKFQYNLRVSVLGTLLLFSILMRSLPTPGRRMSIRSAPSR